jgi:hypothetical protein
LRDSDLLNAIEIADNIIHVLANWVSQLVSSPSGLGCSSVNNMPTPEAS